jgi:predicted nucleotidyltransferase
MNWVAIGSSHIMIPSFLKIFFPYKEKRLFWMPKNKILYLLLQNKISIIVMNWIFQGVFGLSKIDLIGKLILECCLFLILFLSLGNLTSNRLILSFLFAHTVNWIFNTHFWVLGRFIGITRTPTHRFYQYLKNMQNRIRETSGISGVIIIGGASRGEKIRETSDVDIFFIVRESLLSKIKALLFTIKERAIAFLRMFPLDLYLYENVFDMNKHRKDENPFVLFDREGIVKDYYKRQNREVVGLNNFPKQ